LGCADLYNPKVVQSTMASIARVNVFYDKNNTWLSKQKVPVYAAALNGKPVYQFKNRQKGILLIGNESKGLRRELLDTATEHITIPGRGSAESLNAAVATGIILSHFYS
jgi:TrmH family RNA methyltransferase